MNHIWAVPAILALIIGLANHARGRGTLLGGRVACAAYGGIGIGLCAFLIGFEPLRAIATSLSTSLGLYNWLCWGWGLYFAAFHGVWKLDEEDISWIDNICLWLVPFVQEERHWTNYARGMLGMALRGLYLLPMFFLIDPLHGLTSLHVWWLGLFGPVQGLIYAVNRIGGIWKREGTALPELLMGMTIGALAGTALVLIVLTQGT
jgi:hypothetical protein